MQIFFDKNLIVHKDSGMMIKITPRGIRETFGNGKRFNATSKSTKQRKVATIIHIKNLIKSPKLLNLPNGQYKRLRTFLFIVFELLNLPNGYCQADPQETRNSLIIYHSPKSKSTSILQLLKTSCTMTL